MLSKKIKYDISSKYLVIILPSVFYFISYLHNINLGQYEQDISLAIVLSIIFIFNFEIKYSDTFKKINTYMAEYSYSIYAFHMPLIFFFFSIEKNSFINGYSLVLVYFFIFILVLFLARIFFHIGENKRYAFKKIIQDKI